MREISPQEVLSRDEYESRRDEIRRKILMEKARRRVPVGEHCMVHFENHQTMLYQVHEMLRAEGTWGNERALRDELEAYNPLIPSDGELSATVMFEYETEAERALVLPRLVGIDRHLWLQIGESAPLLASLDRGQIDETRVSSVQYAKWALSAEERRQLTQDGTVLRLRIDHPAYEAQAVLSEETRRAIQRDPQ